MRKETVHSGLLEIHSTWGIILVGAREGRVLFCELPLIAHTPAQEFRFVKSSLDAANKHDTSVLKKAEHYIVRSFDGKKADVPELEWPRLSTFADRVLHTIHTIPHGVTMTYGAIARQIGSPRSARAVGTACGANPLPIFIPCHRVVAANGRLGGFSSGKAWKAHLLKAERTYS